MFDDLFDATLWDDSSPSVDDNMSFDHDCFGDINPGSGLPMSDCSIDVGGFVYGDGPDYSEL